MELRQMQSSQYVAAKLKRGGCVKFHRHLLLSIGQWWSREALMARNPDLISSGVASIALLEEKVGRS